MKNSNENTFLYKVAGKCLNFHTSIFLKKKIQETSSIALYECILPRILQWMTFLSSLNSNSTFPLSLKLNL